MLLIDAYNVLHHAYLLPGGLSEISAPSLGKLVDDLGFHDGRIVVVCDGAPKPHERTADPGPKAEILHAGPGREADDLIEDFIEKESSPRRMIVVSNDRRLIAAARRRKAVVMSSEDFLRALADLLRQGASSRRQPSDGSEKPASADAEEWMRKFGIHDKDKDAKIKPSTDQWMKEFGIEE